MENNTSDLAPPEQAELLPVETLKHEGALAPYDPIADIQLMEQRAALAPRWIAARNKILLSATHAEDWTKFGDKMCLSSAGAERIGTHFNISFSETKFSKQTWTDKFGAAYSYLYEGYASLHGKKLPVSGQFSTRDKFLGKKGNEYRPIEDINENHIRAAAYHIYIGNGIKALLGLRAMPQGEWEKIFKDLGKAPAKAGSATFAEGSQGGSSAKDTEKQNELRQMLLDLAIETPPLMVDVAEDDENNLIHCISPITADLHEAKLEQIAEHSLVNLSTWKAKDGKLVAGRTRVQQLKGKQLNLLATRLQKLIEERQ